MFNQHFYHETIRRSVAVFGTLFNNINVLRTDANGNVLNQVKVPLSYGPKQKFLSRIDQQSSLNDSKIAIKLPRMSFEITSLDYDSTTALQKGQTQTITNEDGSKSSVLGPVSYNMGIQLNIMAKNQDDALQILEQIIPFFQPDYNVTIKQVNDNFKTDMPFTLSGISMADDYEGDYVSRRSIVYTLDFQTKVRFYGPISRNNVILRTNVDIINQNDDTLQERQLIVVNPLTANETDNYTLDVSYAFGYTPDRIQLTVGDSSGFDVGEIVYGSISATSGQVESIVDNVVTVFTPDGLYSVGESLISNDGSHDTIITNQVEINE